MTRSNHAWKALGLIAGVALLARILYHPSPRPELTIATVSSADMTLLPQLSSEFEKQSAAKLNWVVLGENILRQRLTMAHSMRSSTLDVITAGRLINSYTHERAASLLSQMGLEKLRIEAFPLGEFRKAFEAQMAGGAAAKTELLPQLV